MGGTRTHVLLHGKPQKSLIKLYASSLRAVSGSQLIKLIKSVTSLVSKKKKSHYFSLFFLRHKLTPFCENERPKIENENG